MNWWKRNKVKIEGKQKELNGKYTSDNGNLRKDWSKMWAQRQYCWKWKEKKVWLKIEKCISYNIPKSLDEKLNTEWKCIVLKMGWLYSLHEGLFGLDIYPYNSCLVWNNFTLPNNTNRLFIPTWRCFRTESMSKSQNR